MIKDYLIYGFKYRHFTDSIENYFSMFKSLLHKLDVLIHEQLKKI